MLSYWDPIAATIIHHELFNPSKSKTPQPHSDSGQAATCSYHISGYSLVEHVDGIISPDGLQLVGMGNKLMVTLPRFDENTMSQVMLHIHNTSVSMSL